jgi:hypothetical protein
MTCFAGRRYPLGFCIAGIAAANVAHSATS